VSRRLSVLESKLGVSLLRRTTRRITLTAQGREYFNQCREPLPLLEEAERVLTLGQNTPEGLLRISVPVILGQGPFMDFLSEFLRAQARGLSTGLARSEDRAARGEHRPAALVQDRRDLMIEISLPVPRLPTTSSPCPETSGAMSDVVQVRHYPRSHSKDAAAAPAHGKTTASGG
jgi:DNA-binding transcriptional LysR family regulator